MEYFFTDFVMEDQPLINKIRESGMFVYSVRDGEDKHYTIEKRAMVNRIGFVVTDTELPLTDGVITDVEFENLGGTASVELVQKVQRLKTDILDKEVK